MAAITVSNKRPCLTHPREDHLPMGSRDPFMLDYLLSGLSMKVLMRCRIVCKAWFHIIDVLYPWIKDLNPGKTRIFGCSGGDEMTGPRIYGITIHGDEMKANQIAIYPGLRGFRHKVSGKVSMCNGLILFERHEELRILESAVVNPLTKEIVMVPGSPYLPVLYDNLALGYDSLSGTHKLVQLLVRDENSNLGAAIYDSRGRSWRFHGFPDELLESSYDAFENHDQERSRGVCVAGTLYWTLHGQQRRIVVAFDVGREIFKRVPTPTDFKKMKNFERPELANVRGGLALWNLSFGHRMVMWMMMADINKEERSWNETLVMFLDGPLYTTDDVFGVYHYDGDRVLVRGRSPITGESLFVMKDINLRWFKCSLKDGCCGIDVYSHSWNSTSMW